MLKVGLTGGVGSGKSTALSFFKSLGVPTFNADAVAKEVTQAETVRCAIRSYFGDEALLPSGELNRPFLRERIFSVAQEKKWLESLLHPLIAERIEAQLAAIDAPYVVIEIPLLIEKRLSGEKEAILVDRVCVIQVPHDQQVKRVQERDQISIEAVNQIKAVQASDTARQNHADDFLYNHHSFIELEQQVKVLDAFYKKLRS
jgi:dephospho-CoA kinase